MSFRSRSSINMCSLKCLYDLFVKFLVVGNLVLPFMSAITPYAPFNYCHYQLKPTLVIVTD